MDFLPLFLLYFFSKFQLSLSLGTDGPRKGRSPAPMIGHRNLRERRVISFQRSREGRAPIPEGRKAEGLFPEPSLILQIGSPEVGIGFAGATHLRPWRNPLCKISFFFPQDWEFGVPVPIFS